MKTLAIAAAAFGLACTAATAPAFATQSTTMAMDIKVNDIDLETAKGQKILERRIDQAARAVCGVEDVRTGTRIRSYEARACLKEAKTQARQQVAALVADRQRGG
ncbi:UrcA family protein [Erythrobacter sp. NFXS35]|uniref:UrcA family protein n=1 Tax=Erythrobacter sp. NFXS35 TaxID=2818436 RepID=UPI0032DE6EF1